MFAGPDNTSWGHRSVLVPTTWNPADKAAECTLSNGDLTATFSAGDKSCRGIAGIDAETGLGVYCEFTCNAAAATGTMFGFALISAPLTGSNHYLDAASWCFTFWNGKKVQTSPADMGAALAPGETGMFALKGGKAWWGKEGTFFDSGDPETDANPAFGGLTGTVYPYANCTNGGGAAITVNFGQTSFVHGPPAGFLPGWGVIE